MHANAAPFPPTLPPAAYPYRDPGSGWKARDLWLLYPAVLFSLPDDFFGNLPVAPESMWMVAVLYSTVLVELAFRRGQRVWVAASRVPVPAMLFLGLLLLSWSVHRFGGNFTLAARLVLWVMTFAYGLYFAVDARDRRNFFTLWTVLGLVAALTLVGSPGRWGQERVDVMAFQHRTGLGYFMGLPASLLLYRTFVAGRRPSLWTGTALCILLAGVLMALSRGAWLVLYLGVLALLVYRGRRVTAAAIFGVSLAALVSFGLLSDSDLALRIRSVWDFRVRSSSFYRLDLLQAALRSLPEVGLLGSGPGSAGEVLARYTLQQYRHLSIEGLAERRFVTDSDVVWLLIEAGPLVLLGLLLLLGWWARRLFLGFRLSGEGVESGEDRAANLLLLVLIVAMLLFDNILTTPFGWFLLGSGLGALPRLERARAGPVPARRPGIPIAAPAGGRR